MKNQMLAASLTAAVIAIANMGCESKFNESSPDGVPQQGTSLTERLQQKIRVDERISELNAKATRLKRIVSLVQQVRGARAGQETYTPLDLLIDLNKELKQEIPNEKSKKLVRYGKILLPDAISAECREIETLLETDDIKFEDEVVGERLTYSFKACGTHDKYLPAFEAEFAMGQTRLRMINSTLNGILRATLLADNQLMSTCTFEGAGKDPIGKVTCKNIKTDVSASEQLIVKNLTYTSTGPVRLEANAELYENQILKALMSGVIFSNGQVQFNLEAVK